MNAIIIQKIAIPIGGIDQDHFEAPDLVPAWDYYPRFIRMTKHKISPAEYLNEIVSIVKVDEVARARLLTEFSDYIGNFLSSMGKNHKIYMKCGGK